jgi:hypothetical protein
MAANIFMPTKLFILIYLLIGEAMFSRFLCLPISGAYI